MVLGLTGPADQHESIGVLPALHDVEPVMDERCGQAFEGFCRTR